jgi:hypothetical protein
MALEELKLVGDDRLVLRAVVDVEVVDARVDAQLTLRGAPWRIDRRPGLGDLIASGDADQPGAVQRGGVANRTVRGPQQPARGNPVAPA